MLAGKIADTPEEAEAAAAAIGGTVVVKAQVKTGGRGKAGGVKVAHSPAEAKEKARSIAAPGLIPELLSPYLGSTTCTG